jgi:hypothetical protein
MEIKSRIELNLYCDEIKEQIYNDPIHGQERWMYIGVLIVPKNIEKVLMQNLLNKRCGANQHKTWGKCPNKCQYHRKNNKEAHYTNCDSADEYHIALRWLDYMLSDFEYTYFYILGINLTNLDYKYFANGSPTDRFNSIYNRFFRTAILKPIKNYFYKYKEIIIESIIHDEAELKEDEYFPWHSIYKIKKDGTILVKSNEIEFIQSDHKKSNDVRSHFLQYIDIIMGSIFNSLHWQSQDEKKTALAEKVYPLLHRLMHEPSNKNSSFCYFLRKSLDFFPSTKILSLKGFEQYEIKGGFYKIREPRIKKNHQPTLF